MTAQQLHTAINTLNVRRGIAQRQAVRLFLAGVPSNDPARAQLDQFIRAASSRAAFYRAQLR